MSGTLDNFLPPYPVKSKPTCIGIEENCSKCGNKIPVTEPKHYLIIKGEKKPFCADCYRKTAHARKKKEEKDSETED